MASRKKTWTYNPQKPKKIIPIVPEVLEKKLKEKADKMIESVLKPEYIKPPPKGSDFNYIADIFSKWYRNYFYFCATYNCPGPNAIAPSFENKFARMEYLSTDKYAVSYMRHTGQWLQLFDDISMDEALKEISDGAYFHP